MSSDLIEELSRLQAELERQRDLLDAMPTEPTATRPSSSEGIQTPNYTPPPSFLEAQKESVDAQMSGQSQSPMNASAGQESTEILNILSASAEAAKATSMSIDRMLEMIRPMVVRREPSANETKRYWDDLVICGPEGHVLDAFKSCEKVDARVTDFDERILKSLVSLRTHSIVPSVRSFVFVFKPNEFFKNKVLEKRLQKVRAEGKFYITSHATPIDWSPNRKPAGKSFFDFFGIPGNLLV